MLTLLTALALKHFICDFPLQHSPWMFLNKGTYGHPGGVAHAAVHQLGTTLVLLALAPQSAHWTMPYYLGLVDHVAHYHIDWLKVNITRHYELGPTTSHAFWDLVGLDQLLHHLTYIAIVWSLT